MYSEEEQLAEAMRESRISLEKERRRHNVQSEEHSTENDEIIARQLHEALNPVGTGGSQRLSDSYERPFQPSGSSYQRHQQQYDYPHMSERKSSRDLRIVLLGMTGSGKSSSGNSIVGRKVFKATPSGSSETSYCEHTQSVVQGRNVLVVDTPGLFDTRQTNNDTMREITRCVALSAPGPHALILVVEGGNRASAQTQRCAEMIMEVFGDKAIGHMIILFTRLDNITYDGYTLDYFVRSLPPEMKRVLHKCDNRYVAFNNRETSAHIKGAQVDKLLDLIDHVVDANGGRCFTNDVYKDFEKMMVKKEENLKKKYDKDRMKELQEFQRRVDEEAQRRLDVLQKKENDKKLRHDQVKEAEKRLEAEMNEKFNAKLRELEEQYNQKVEQVRVDAREEVQNDREGSGDLFDEGMLMVARGIGYVGDGIKSAGKGIATAAIGFKNAAASIPNKVLSFFFG